MSSLLISSFVMSRTDAQNRLDPLIPDEGPLLETSNLFLSLR